jgi:hypothetical protein
MSNITNLAAARQQKDVAYRKRLCLELERMSVAVRDYKTADAARELLNELERNQNAEG